MATEEKQNKRVTTPEGRLINFALFERDIYKDARGKEAEPKYKVEMAFDPDDVTGEGTIEDAVLDAAIAKWGDKAEDDFFEGKIGSPFLDGDRMAEKREA